MKKLTKQNNITPGQRWIYVILGIIIMMCLGTVYSWSVFRLHVEELYNVGTTESGFPYMISLAFYALFMFLTGKHLDKYSPRVMISFGSILVAVGWILSGYAPNIYILTITYGVIIGAGVGIAYGAPMTVVARWFPEKKGLVVGLILTGFGLSPLITAPVARYFIEVYGIVQSFKILGISFGIIIPLLSYPFRYPSDNDYNYLKTTSNIIENINDVNTEKMIKSKSFKSLYFSFIIGTMIGLMLIGMTSNVGIELVKLPSKTVTLLISLFAVFNGISRPIFGWITDKLSPKKAMIISYGLSIVAASLMLMADEGSLVLFIISFSIFWFNLGGWLAIAPTSTLNIYGIKWYSQNYGVVFTAYGIGAIIGVLASGLLMDFLHSYNAIFYFVIILCIIGIFISQKITKTNENII
ncbi:L-lactate MFS transporter [Clostridium sp. UBA4395]|uniref:L-lactate MFS transporter n=1 Tax=Clostridium sp. UBA4395 TaxID=1946360 RepID=UPI003217B1DE